ncbi:MAG: AmmeMemoRadiSam system protein A [Sphaerochaetaceae bacterium]
MERADQMVLLRIARDSIGTKLGRAPTGVYEETREKGDEVLNERHGAFVTLHEKGQLRGCIGYLLGDRPLYKLIHILARESAFEDYRFEPVFDAELDDCTIEISVLSVPKLITDLEQFVPERDGIILTEGGKRAVFLPQVATEQHWGRVEMLENLCLKAGLDRDAWKQSDATFATFVAEVFSE